MPDPKRRFWQIHLSTAIVLMFVAGLIIWRILFLNDRYHASRGEFFDNDWWPESLSLILCSVPVLALTAITSEWFLRRRSRQPEAIERP